MLTDRGSTAPNASDSSTKKSVLKHPLLYSSCVVAIVALYVGWTVFSRWNENRQIEQRASEERAARQREQDRSTVEQMGGSTLAIQMFYVSPKTIHRGETAQLCYAVANAKTVTLEPQDSPVWPSPSRCVDVSPGQTTSYTLTIDDGAGHSQTQSLELKVH